MRGWTRGVNEVTEGPVDDGLPEVADDDSYADDVHEGARDSDGRDSPLPPDREDGPLALDEYGTTAGEHRRGESLSRRLTRERPDVLDGDAWAEPDTGLAEDGDPEAVDQLDDDSVALVDADPIDPALGSVVSMYDRAVPGIPSGGPVGRLVRPGGGYASVDADEFAYDVGPSAGGFTSEELAMHEVSPDELDRESSG
jgi:hypothetical protein